MIRNPNTDTAYIKALIADEIRARLATMKQSQHPKGKCSVTACLRLINQANKAEKGDLFSTPKK